MAMGQIPPLVVPPFWPGGGETDPVLPSEPIACTLDNGQPGWSYDEAGTCFPYPGAPGFPAPTAPTTPGFPKIPGVPAPTPPPGVPELPPGAALPGYVSEADCAVREQSSADATRRIEEGKAIKYAIITAVVSGVVGVVIGKVLT